MNIIFWNLQKRDLVQEISDLFACYNCDYAAFAETDDELLDRLVKHVCSLGLGNYRQLITPGCEKVHIIYRYDKYGISILAQQSRFSIQKIVNNHQKKLIIASVHLPSRHNRSIGAIRSVCEYLHAAISEEEGKLGVNDSLVIGDFNVNPFEEPMVSFFGMLASNSQDTEFREYVSCMGRQKRMFYNPMWILYQRYCEIPGGHKYDRIDEDVIWWHFPDQVVIRPSLIKSFDFESLQVVPGTHNYCFVNRYGKPKTSDHLPIFCKLKF